LRKDRELGLKMLSGVFLIYTLMIILKIIAKVVDVWTEM
jgi:hypothetical protein